MESSEAQRQLEMVDRIMAASERELSIGDGALFFIIWGLFAGFVSLMFELARHDIVGPEALWSFPAALFVAVLASILCGRYIELHKDRSTLLRREFLRVLAVTIGVVFVAMAGAWRLFPGVTAGAIWSVACSIVLFFIAMHGNRRALACGVIVLLSLIAANFTPGIQGYVLGAGFLIGYAGFGVAEWLARS